MNMYDSYSAEHADTAESQPCPPKKQELRKGIRALPIGFHETERGDYPGIRVKDFGNTTLRRVVFRPDCKHFLRYSTINHIRLNMDISWCDCEVTTFIVYFVIFID